MFGDGKTTTMEFFRGNTVNMFGDLRTKSFTREAIVQRASELFGGNSGPITSTSEGIPFNMTVKTPWTSNGPTTSSTPEIPVMDTPQRVHRQERSWLYMTRPIMSRVLGTGFQTELWHYHHLQYGDLFHRKRDLQYPPSERGGLGPEQRVFLRRGPAFPRPAAGPWKDPFSDYDNGIQLTQAATATRTFKQHFRREGQRPRVMTSGWG